MFFEKVWRYFTCFCAIEYGLIFRLKYAILGKQNGDDMVEYVKYYWKYIDAETPVLVFAELNEARYATRDIAVYPDRHMERFGGNGKLVSEEPYDSNAEINSWGEFWITDISKEEFECVWDHWSGSYPGDVSFPKNLVP